MTTEPTPAPVQTPKPAGHNPLKDKALEIKEVPEVLTFLRENGAAVIVGAGIAAAIFLGWSLFRNYQSSQREAAANLLFSAQTPEQIQQVVSQYPKSPAAPLASLLLAGQAFDQGQYEVAQNLFSAFLDQHPTHLLADQARMGILQCMEAAGRYAEALDGYTGFVADKPGHYLEATAVFGKARSLELLGRLDEARATYEAFIAAHADDERMRGRAESALSFLNKEARARARGDVAPAPTAPAFSFPALQSAAPAPPAQPAP